MLLFQPLTSDPVKRLEPQRAKVKRRLNDEGATQQAGGVNGFPGAGCALTGAAAFSGLRLLRFVQLDVDH